MKSKARRRAGTSNGWRSSNDEPVSESDHDHVGGYDRDPEDGHESGHERHCVLPYAANRAGALSGNADAAGPCRNHYRLES